MKSNLEFGASLAEGSKLQSGKYVIKRVLGQGGFGITYLAEHTMLDIKVAIKEFFPSSYCLRQSDSTVSCLDSNLDFVSKLQSKFVKEARYIAGLRHDNIIKILDIFQENNTAYYVMDYIDGCSLQELVKESGPLPLYDASKYISQIGAALDYIHTLKIGHYDVKPGNILINAKVGQAILIDFGLSKQFTEIEGESTSSLIGYSNGYAPIEQYDQNNKLKFNPATDTYSLTATLYFIISGERPQTSTEIVSHGLSISDLIPLRVRDVIRKGLQVQITKRFSSCAELSKAFETAIKVNRPVEFANDIWNAAKNRLMSRKNDISDEDISIIEVSSRNERDLTQLNDDSSDNPVHISSLLQATSVKSSNFYEKLIDRLNKINPKPEKRIQIICNSVIFVSLIAFLSTDLNELYVTVRYSRHYVTSLISLFAGLSFLFSLWIYILRRKPNNVTRCISWFYSIWWVFQIWYDYTLIIPYLIGLVLLYGFYKSPKMLQSVILCMVSMLTSWWVTFIM